MIDLPAALVFVDQHESGTDDALPRDPAGLGDRLDQPRFARAERAAQGNGCACGKDPGQGGPEGCRGRFARRDRSSEFASVNQIKPTGCNPWACRVFRDLGGYYVCKYPRGGSGWRLPCVVDLPQAPLGDELADAGERHGQRLLGQHPLGFVRRHGQDQLEIFAVAQGVVKGRRAVGKSSANAGRRR